MMKFRKAMTLLLIGVSPLIMAAFLEEPWNTLLFLVAIPFIQQGIKLLRDKSGKTIGKLGNQAISLALTIAFVALNGEFAGITWPALPVFGDDLILFITDALRFVGELSVLIGASWGTMMVLYEAIWDRLFTAAEYATEDKLV
jgi:hypothetical protein